VCNVSFKSVFLHCLLVYFCGKQTSVYFIFLSKIKIQAQKENKNVDKWQWIRSAKCSNVT